MAVYKQHIRFFAIFFLFTVIIGGARVYWLHKALPSKATLLYTELIGSGLSRQYYPVVSYKTQNEQVAARGTSNLPISSHQAVDILYNPDNVQEFRLNTTYWLWHDIWSWYRLILVVIVMYYVALFVIRKSSTSSTRDVIVSRNEGRPNSHRKRSNTHALLFGSVAKEDARFMKKTKRLSRRVKALLLLLLPITVFLVGHIFDVSIAKQVGIIIFLSFIALAPFSGSSAYDDI